MNIWIHEDKTPNEHEGHIHIRFLNIGILGSYVKKFIFNKYLRFGNWSQKSDLILNSKDRSTFIEFQEKKSKKREIIEKLKPIDLDVEIWWNGFKNIRRVIILAIRRNKWQLNTIDVLWKNIYDKRTIFLGIFIE